MKWLKRIVFGFLCLVAILLVAVAMLKVTSDARYFAGYDAAAPLDARVADVEERPGYLRTHFYYKGNRGEEVPALMASPKEGKGPWPCVIFLHGIGQNKGFLDEIAEPFVKDGYAFVSFDQLMRGERKAKYANFLQEALAFRNRPAYTINDTRRMVDYLQTRSDICGDRIYLVGASYGAITGSTASAFDSRIKAVVLTYGGGNLPKMLTARLIKKELGGLLFPAQAVAAAFLGVVDPVKYIDKISPRPILFQNGTDDGLIATEAADAFFAAAKDPKKRTIYPGDHVGMDEAQVPVILREALDFIKQEDAKATGGKLAAL